MDNVSLNPKETFLKEDKFVGAFRNICRSDDMKRVLTVSLTHFTIAYRPNQDELAGALKFIETFLNIGEKDSQPAPNYLDKPLTPPELIGKKTPEQKPK